MKLLFSPLTQGSLSWKKFSKRSDDAPFFFDATFGLPPSLLPPSFCVFFSKGTFSSYGELGIALFSFLFLFFSKPYVFSFPRRCQFFCFWVFLLFLSEVARSKSILPPSLFFPVDKLFALFFSERSERDPGSEKSFLFMPEDISDSFLFFFPFFRDLRFFF